MTNGQLTAILCTLVALVIFVVAYPAVHRELTTHTPTPVTCKVVSTEYNPNVAAPYVQTECNPTDSG